eukprot:416541-Prorocentrum_minimum.AAC.1
MTVAFQIQTRGGIPGTHYLKNCVKLWVVYGNQSTVTGITFTEGTDYIKLNNPVHTANLTNGNLYSYQGDGDLAMTNFPIYVPSQFHWGIGGGGSRWEVDDMANNANYNTYHQIWVRANKPNTTSLTNVEIPQVIDITGNAFPSSAVNYAHVYLYGTDG